MQVKMLQAQAGPLVVREVGEVVDVGDDEAERLIAAGFAEAAEPKPKPRRAAETATVEAPEAAVAPRAKPRRAAKRG